ncbi:MAG: hypothetical protein H0V12_00630 [Chloroflexi bacterium]|nr:hypothetical protein [Chloroflexota bacterium]
MDETRPDDEIRFPVDDATYDLLQTLTSKLEALDAYRTYLEDADEESSQLFRQMAEQDTQVAQRLLELLRQRL